MLSKLNAWLHLWLGLVSGIIIVILSITGCILVFKQELNVLTKPWMRVEQPQGKSQLPPSVLYEQVSKQLPDNIIYNAWYHGQDRSVQMNIDSDSVVYVNPYTAEIIALVDHEDFFHFIEEGHYHLWLPDHIAHHVVGWSMAIFLILLITGLVLWWPKKWNKKHRDDSFKIRWKARFKRLNYDLHNVLGFYSLLIALLMVLTALIMCFPWFSNAAYWVTGGVKTERIRSLSDTTQIQTVAQLSQVDKAWKLGMDSIGEYNKDQIIINYPKKASDVISLCVDMTAGSWRYVNLDQHTLQQLPSTDLKMKDEQFAKWLRRSNYTLHVGAFGGIPTKILYFVASLICASLPITGFYVWWGKRKKNKKKTQSKRAVFN